MTSIPISETSHKDQSSSFDLGIEQFAEFAPLHGKLEALCDASFIESSGSEVPFEESKR